MGINKSNIKGIEHYNDCLPKRLRELSEEKGISREDLSMLCGKTPQNISNYLNGVASPPINVLKLLAEKFSVSSDYLIGLTDTKIPDITVQEICKFTGLSEDAVCALNAFKNNFYSALQVFSNIITHDDFLEMILGIYSIKMEADEAETATIDDNVYGKYKSLKFEFFEANEVYNEIISDISGKDQALDKLSILMGELINADDQGNDE